MRIKQLKIKNYRQFKEALVEFPDGVIGIVGLNGAGKTTLIESIAWALFGNVAVSDRSQKEGIKRVGATSQEDVSVELVLEIAGIEYQIIRKLKGAGQSGDASISAQGKKLAASVRGTDKEIGYILGMDYKSFYTSFFAKQKELNALSDLTPTQRKDTVIRMLRIDAIDKAIDKIKSEIRVGKTEADLLKGATSEESILELHRDSTKKEIEIKTINKELNKTEETIGKMDAKLATFKERFTKERTVFQQHSNAEKKLSETTSRLEFLNDRKQKLEQELADLKTLEKEASKLGTAENDYQDLKQRLEKQEELRLHNLDVLQKDLNIVSSELAGISEKLKEVENKGKDLQAEHKKITQTGKNAPCPTCHRPLDEIFDKLLSDFELQIKQLRSQYKELKQDKTNKEQQKDKLEKLIDKMRHSKEFEGEKYSAKEHELIKKKLMQAEISRDKLLKIKPLIEKGATAYREYEKIKKETSVLENSILTIEKQLKNIAYDEKSHEKITNEYDELNQKRDEIFSLRNDLKINLAAAQQELDMVNKDIKEAEENKNKAKDIIKRQEELNLLEGIMKDYRQHLISRIRPELSTVSSKLFAELTNYKYNGIELDENYEMHIFEGGIKYPLNRFSGGEADLANLCLRLAISELISNSAGTEGGFVILDEIFGSQDILRKNAILDSLAQMSRRYRQIMLITHVDDIKDMVESIIEVQENEQGVSQVKQS